MKARLLMILFVLVLGTILTATLVAVNYYTTPVIEKNEEIKKKSSVLDALGISYTREDVEQVFASHVKAEQKDGKTFYIAGSGDIAFNYSGAGLWGPITGIVALRPDLKTIAGVTVIQQEETPGLGGRIAEQSYLDQFSGKVLAPALKVTAPGRAKADNEIDAITGATLTSNAFIAILNNQLEAYLSAYRGGK